MDGEITARTPLRFNRVKPAEEEGEIEYKPLVKARMKMHMNVNIV